MKEIVVIVFKCKYNTIAVKGSAQQAERGLMEHITLVKNGLRFGSQEAHGCSQRSLMQPAGDPNTLSGLRGHRHGHGTQIHMEANISIR